MDRSEIILKCNEYLKAKTDSKFVFGGSYGLYIHGIEFERELHDMDIKFLDLDKDELSKLKLDFSPKIHKLKSSPIGSSEYVEVEFCGEKLLVFTPQFIVDCKKATLNYIENVAKIKSEGRLHSAEKIREDLKYLKEKYGLE